MSNKSPDRITLKNEDVSMKMRASSVFKGDLEVLTESPVKRIWRDFYGFLAEMFYKCFTLRRKCFTLSNILSKIDGINN